MVLLGDDPASALDTPDALARARDEVAAFVVHGLIADA